MRDERRAAVERGEGAATEHRLVAIAGAAALLIVSIGVVAVLVGTSGGGDGGRGATAVGATVWVSPAGASAGVPWTPTEPPAISAPAGAPSPEVSSLPASDPTALGDGSYPAYVRTVDIAGATVTVDVIQTFEGPAAVRAALTDGLSRHDARAYRYMPVYIRNDNPLLRTLPVAEDVEIRFVGGCEAADSATAALRELRRAVRSSDDTFYYVVALSEGSIARIDQRVAVPAC